jgi:death-on-curing protein
MRYLTFSEVISLHRQVMAQSGGMAGIRDLSGLRSALAQPQMTFGGQDLYPTLAEKAAALGFFLVSNHPFVDGNKRTGHAVMETFLLLNGYELSCSVDNQEAIILQLAAGEVTREVFTAWVQRGAIERKRK